MRFSKSVVTQQLLHFTQKAKAPDALTKEMFWGKKLPMNSYWHIEADTGKHVSLKPPANVLMLLMAKGATVADLRRLAEITRVIANNADGRATIFWRENAGRRGLTRFSYVNDIVKRPLRVNHKCGKKGKSRVIFDSYQGWCVDVIAGLRHE